MEYDPTTQVRARMTEIRKWRFAFDGPTDTTGAWCLYGSRGKQYATVRAEGERYRVTAVVRRKRVVLGVYDDLAVAKGAARRATDPAVSRP